MRMPFAALLVEFEIVAEKYEREQQEAWLHDAFVGWQMASVMGGKAGAFKKYAKQLGLTIPGVKVTPEQVAAEKQQALRNAERVRQAFDGG